MLLCFRAVGGYLVQPAFLRCFEVGFCSFDLFIFKREVLRLLGERKDKLLGSVSSPQLFSTVRDFALRLSTETVFLPFLCTRRSGRSGLPGFHGKTAGCSGWGLALLPPAPFPRMVSNLLGPALPSLLFDFLISSGLKASLWTCCC